MSSIYWRNGIAWLKYRDELGVMQRESLRTRNRTQARNLKTEKDAQILRRKMGLEEAPPRSMEFGALLDTFLTDISDKLESGADDRYRAKHLKKLRGKRLNEVTPGDIRKILNTMEEQGRSPQTRHHIRSLIRRAFNYAIAELKCFRGENPACAKSLRVTIPEKNPRFIPADWVLPIIQAVPDEYRGIFAMDAMTGLRKGEVCGLMVTDIDLDGRKIHVRRSYGKKSTKDKKERVVPIPEALVPYLRVELGRVRSKWLFPARDGGMRKKHWKAARVMRIALKKAGLVEGYNHKCRRKGCGFGTERRADDAPSACPKCGMKLWVEGVPLKFNFKDLRSTFLTHLLGATGNITLAQRVAGHSTSELTEKHYIGRDQEALRQASNAVPYAMLAGHKLGTAALESNSASADVVRISKGNSNA